MNIIILSGLAGSGKTYVADKIKELVKDKFEVKWLRATQENYSKILDAQKTHNNLIILEMHPPFFVDDNFRCHNFIHVVISKDWEKYLEDIKPDKVKFIDKFFDDHPERERWNHDIIKYNRVRFDHIGHVKDSECLYEIASDCDEAIGMIMHFTEQIRKKELFLYANKNYDWMLYHSVDFDGIRYSGTAPSKEKFDSLKLLELFNKTGHDPNEHSALDIGCNIGYLSYLLKPHFWSIKGFDIEKENIYAAEWLKEKFFRDKEIEFDDSDFMNFKGKYHYVFALAVLHHIAKKHSFENICKHLSDLTRIAAVVEINEMPQWPIERIISELQKHFKEVRVIGNGYLPVGKQISKNRWIIHCIK